MRWDKNVAMEEKVSLEEVSLDGHSGQQHD